MRICGIFVEGDLNMGFFSYENENEDYAPLWEYPSQNILVILYIKLIFIIFLI